eukprot:TRINITY_DN21036_c0_g1_i1.p1 TRINITY_DN21036_c0_g1~~TRINITY_DN21036_c0_g1_i1.p1  ORF type:complete len:109 (-),score=37.66 TRINITY_DN21036_c0_g1_i1:4-330(-)
MLRSLVGSEMCIRDRFVMLQSDIELEIVQAENDLAVVSNCAASPEEGNQFVATYNCCLLYTSDAADEEDSVDLGGRRIIKKKKIINHYKLTQLFACRNLVDFHSTTQP